ncbi:conserved hypothetical protein [Burkholderia pseudomallei Pakistan 9]|uniref:Uncharacterized protein n=1 Tax=Burkholderia pseudomallei 1710a TaxID=320371 RepID=A0A0E1W6Z2_BURPE|nr:hypothetical protein BURPS668_2617 [Burkholderia pseudomallei 668]EEH28463.1 conserved hypothetical protein [Burkholderia pseudomallei Pakistan 9]EET08184.1 hypothetical protein BURPS1710A_3174 [Burkholderia pseudomallei 1710a]
MGTARAMGSLAHARTAVVPAMGGGEAGARRRADARRADARRVVRGCHGACSSR